MLDCVILAGGLGTRMDSVIPKALIKIGENGLPILEHQLRRLEQFDNIKRIILALGYKSEAVKDYLLCRRHTKEINFSIEDKPLGTAGALKQALDLIVENLVVVFNVDDITNINFSDLEKYGNEISENLMCVAHPRLPFGLVDFKDEKDYVSFREKPILNGLWVSCGWYLLKREIKDKLPKEGSLEYNVFQKEIIKLKPYIHEGVWFALNTKRDIEELERKLDKIYS